MRRPTPKRKRFFIGAEGESERSLAKWFKRLCDAAGLHVHLDIKACNGGDSLTVVTHSVKQYRKRSRDQGQFSGGMVILDADRIEEDKLRGRDPLTGLDSENLSLVYLTPNIEGLLLRLHRGCENRFLSVLDTKRSLHVLWPDYDKPASAKELSSRFRLEDLQRTAQHDAYIRLIMETLGLLR